MPRSTPTLTAFALLCSATAAHAAGPVTITLSAPLGDGYGDNGGEVNTPVASVSFSGASTTFTLSPGQAPVNVSFGSLNTTALHDYDPHGYEESFSLPVPFTFSVSGSPDITVTENFDGSISDLEYPDDTYPNNPVLPYTAFYAGISPFTVDLGPAGVLTRSLYGGIQVPGGDATLTPPVSLGFSLAAAPEPSPTAGLLMGGLGAAGLVLAARRRKA